MRKAGWIALTLSLLGVFAAYYVSGKYFERVPHVEDEMAYVWQAKVFAHGQLTAPSPPDTGEMVVPFVINDHGRRFAKYPPGWPMLLSFGIRLGARDWVNPLLAGLAIWLTYRLGEKIFSRPIALLASILTLTSPFFLMISGSLDSNSLTLVLTLAFMLAWMDTFGMGKKDAESSHKSIPPWITVCMAGLSLGLLFLTRPLTAVAVALPFFAHGIILIIRGGNVVRLKVLSIGALAALIGSLFFMWQYGVTGSFTTDPYTLWWNFDRIGFGKGIGITKGGYTITLALKNAKAMLIELEQDLFGWKFFSWLFLPFGLWASRRNRAGLMTFTVALSLVIGYMLYWAQVGNYSARYYYEGLPGLALITASGIFWLADEMGKEIWKKVQVAATAALVVFLIGYNLNTFLPKRLGKIYGLYGIHSSQLAPFSQPQVKAQAPAIVFVHVSKTWTEYAGLLELEDPFLTSPFIFAWSINPYRDSVLANKFPQRRVLQYFPDNPDSLLEGLMK